MSGLAKPLVPSVPVLSEEDAAQEKKALCISVASLLLSVPALIGA
jgi:hypothetical protein